MKIDKGFIFASMLLDMSNNHEYFFHKYNVSSKLKDNIRLYSKLLKQIKLNDGFFTKDLKKKYFFSWKR